MSGTHVHALYRHGSSAVHRLPAQVKLVGTLVFVFGVVATRREAVAAFVVDAATVVAVIVAAGLSVRFVATRLVVEVPFLLAALSFPFVVAGPMVTILGVEVSTAGLWALWNVVAKATLGLLASIVLAATTPVAGLLTGLAALRVPPIVTGILGFMIRYLDVVLGDLRRMRVAMHSRAFAPRWFGHARPYAAAAGGLFVRSYERGERVYLAMASRGYQGTMPVPERAAGSVSDWVLGLVPGAVAVGGAIGSWVVL